jgi:deoxyribodipyrimidine photo-lyase
LRRRPTFSTGISACEGISDLLSGAPVIVWFRDDLRIADHPALAAAARAGAPLLCVYVLDEEGTRPLGGAARWWLAGSLRALDHELQKNGNCLVLRRGAATRIVPALAAEIGTRAVHWNRRYDAQGTAADDGVAAALKKNGVAVETHHASLLVEPTDKPPKVFTPFWRRLCAGEPPRQPLPPPARLAAAPKVTSEQLDDWQLEPTTPDWAGGLRATWTPGEAGARARLDEFLGQHIAGYTSRRDRPDDETTSRLSPHLRFGEISPFQVWHAAQFAANEDTRVRRDIDKFLSELGWREFSYQLLHGFPALASRNLQDRFDAFPWVSNASALRAWQRGLTGYPIVDAGMRQLWQTGWMHNRVRMVVASFLVKHLLINWTEGERWFWDTLVDADPANNPASWQWVAGCGADAAPYFRIFNPVLQGQKFDPDGRYVREFVPELARLPDAVVHQPWTAPPLMLREAGVTLGETYPEPLIEHAQARQRALAAFERLKK